MVRALAVSLLVLILVASCGGGGPSQAVGAGGGGGAGGAPFDAGVVDPMCKVSSAPYGDAVIAAASCSSTPPPGAPTPPPPKAYSGGTCPKLVAGTNPIMSTGNARSFLLAVPSNLQPNESLPVIFLWYWLRGSSGDFYSVGDVQNAVDQQRFLAVIPDAKGDLFENWPFLASDPASRVQEEFAFFDDMLSCVAAQFNVNLSCVSTAGVSAGALFTDQLVGSRSEYLSSFISLSGGVGGDLVANWTRPTHHLPAIVLWGGPDDVCLFIYFQNESLTLEVDLENDCDFIVECVHNCGHSEPPFTPPPGISTYGGLWQFALDHPYWLPPGTSPYTTKGLPAGVPEWCAVGPGKAVPRTGPCNAPGC